MAYNPTRYLVLYSCPDSEEGGEREWSPLSGEPHKEYDDAVQELTMELERDHRAYGSEFPGGVTPYAYRIVKAG